MPRRRLSRKYDPQDKTARLLHAAAAVIGETGLAGATVPRITRRAGVSRGLLHYHFPTTTALVHAVARAHYAEWVAVLHRAGSHGRDPGAVAVEIVAQARALAGQHPTFWPLRAALDAAAHQDAGLATIVAAGHREAAALIGLVDVLVCGWAVRPAARAPAPDGWVALERAAIQFAASRGAS